MSRFLPLLVILGLTGCIDPPQPKSVIDMPARPTTTVKCMTNVAGLVAGSSTYYWISEPDREYQVSEEAWNDSPAEIVPAGYGGCVR